MNAEVNTPDAPSGTALRKVFCIGRNKTGTTSMASALELLGFSVGSQTSGEMLLEDWGRRDFTKIIELCKTADAFQDVPFSLDRTYQALDSHFPGAKFILTVRDTPEQWYESLIRFHTKIMDKGRLPTVGELSEFSYAYKGYLWREEELVYGVNENNIYDRDMYISHYIAHNRRIMEYFADRPESLLVVNPGGENAMQKICDFLDVPRSGRTMPHLNKSR